MEFNYQIKLIKYCGFFDTPSKKYKIAFKTLQLFNYAVNFYCLITLLTYMTKNFEDVLKFSEVMGPTITTIIFFSKFSLLFFHSNEIFDFIWEIKMLNRTCKVY